MMKNKLSTVIMTFLIGFSLSLLLIPGIAIIGGVTGKYIIKPLLDVVYKENK